MKLSNAASTMGFLSMGSNFIHARERPNLRKLQGQSQGQGQGQGKTVKGTVNLVVYDNGDGTDETFITVDEADGKSYFTDLTEEWLESVGAVPTQTEIEVYGLQVANEKITAAQAKVVNKGPGRELAERELTAYSTGTRTVLAVIIQDFSRNAGEQVPSFNEAALANSVFGSLVGGNDQVNLSSQYRACSQNRLNFVPVSNPPALKDPSKATPIVNGVTTVTVNTGCKTSSCDNILRNEAISAINTAFGQAASNIAHHMMFCLPPNAMSGIAYAWVPGWESVYNDEWCRYVSGQMHEIGHNIGFYHSNEKSSYEDQSGMMGYSYYGSDTPVMCFNAAKSWESDWYENNEVTFTVGTDTAELYTIKGIATVDANNSAQKALIKINSSSSTDHYINFNHQTGVNRETKEGGNQVMIVTAGNEGAGGDYSNLVAKLNAGGSWSGRFNGTRITVKVESINLTTGDAVICVSEVGYVCGGNSAPTRSPSNSRCGVTGESCTTNQECCNGCQQKGKNANTCK